MDPALYTAFGIPYTLVHQTPGSTVITSFLAFHQGVNAGPNYALAKNELLHDFFTGYVQNFRNAIFPHSTTGYSRTEDQLVIRQQSLVRSLHRFLDEGKLVHLPPANLKEAMYLASYYPVTPKRPAPEKEEHLREPGCKSN